MFIIGNHWIVTLEWVLAVSIRSAFSNHLAASLHFATNVDSGIQAIQFRHEGTWVSVSGVAIVDAGSNEAFCVDAYPWLLGLIRQDGVLVGVVERRRHDNKGAVLCGSIPMLAVVAFFLMPPRCSSSSLLHSLPISKTDVKISFFSCGNNEHRRIYAIIFRVPMPVDTR